MSLIDYSNITKYNTTALQDIDRLDKMFLSVDKILGIDYLFGITSLVVVFLVLLLIFRDYELKVSLIISSTITLFISFFYYFIGFILWQHLLVSFAIYVLVIIATFKLTE